MAFMNWLRQRWTLAALTVIVVVADLLAGIWVFTVPIFQAPDEPNHLDYALHIYERGGPFQVRRATDDPRFQPIEYHPTTHYLIEAGRFLFIRNRPERKVEPAYGTRDYFRRLDQNAPLPGAISIHSAPWVAHHYPCGYYTLLAGWLALLRRGTHSLTVLFFGCRLFSVFLLTLNLPLIYLTFGELNLRPLLALSLTAIIGWFPLTSFVASYVQPDNLSWLLVTLSIYAGLRLKHSPAALRWQVLLGLSLAALYLTKLHFFLAVAAAIASLLLVRLAQARLGWMPLTRLLVSLAGPLLAAWMLNAWVSAGCVNTFYQMAHPRPLKPAPLILSCADGLRDYLSGPTFYSFWGNFGYLDTPLKLNTEMTTRAVLTLLYGSSLVLLVLALVRSQHILAAAMRELRSGQVLRGLSLLSGNPLLNGFACFAVFMTGLYTLLGNVHISQGRNWLPFLPALFFAVFVHAPAALAGKRMRRFVTAGLIGAFLIYVGVASSYAVRSIKQRFYPNETTAFTNIAPPLGAAELRTPLSITPVYASPTAGEYIYRLDKPRFLYAIAMEYTLERADQSRDQQRRSTAQLHLTGYWWLRTPNGYANADERLQDINPGPFTSRRVFFLNNMVDEFKLVVPPPPFRFTLHSLEQIEPAGESSPLYASSPSK